MKFEDFCKMWIEKSLEAEKSGATIFVEYSAHVKTLHVRVFSHGWQTNAKPDIRFDFEAW